MGRKSKESGMDVRNEMQQKMDAAAMADRLTWDEYSKNKLAQQKCYQAIPPAPAKPDHTWILIEGLKRLQGGDKVLAAYNAACAPAGLNSGAQNAACGVFGGALAGYAGNNTQVSPQFKGGPNDLHDMLRKG